MKENLQHLNVRANKPSNFKKIEPTDALDLAHHYPSQYLPLPSEKELEFLNTEELVKIGVSVEALDEDTDTIFGKIVGKVKHMEGLQHGQRVSFQKRHIVGIRYHVDDDDDDYD